MGARKQKTSISELLGFPKRLPEEILREVLGPNIFSVGCIINNIEKKAT